MFDEQIERIASGMSPEDQVTFKRAFAFAEKAHEGQKRKSGEPYLMHPVAVAEILWNRFQDVPLTIAGILHDTVEDCEEISSEDIHDEFGSDVCFLVDAVNKRVTHFHNNETVIEDKIERLLWAGMQDIRAILLKIADREHNVGTLKNLKTEKQVRFAFETQAIFQPLKQIVKFYEATTVEETLANFKSYLTENKLDQPADLKEHLFSKLYKNFNHELFNLVYNNSDKVIWEIEDKECFERMLSSKEFEQHATVHCMWTDGENFQATFTFDDGYLVEEDAGLKVAAYQY